MTNTPKTKLMEHVDPAKWSRQKLAVILILALAALLFVDFQPILDQMFKWPYVIHTSLTAILLYLILVDEKHKNKTPLECHIWYKSYLKKRNIATSHPFAAVLFSHANFADQATIPKKPDQICHILTYKHLNQIVGTVMINASIDNMEFEKEGMDRHEFDLFLANYNKTYGEPYGKITKTVTYVPEQRMQGVETSE